MRCCHNNFSAFRTVKFVRKANRGLKTSEVNGVKMKIYFLIYETDGAGLLPFLSKGRLERAQAVKSSAVRSRTIFSYALLRLALMENFGMTEAPEFGYEPHGKPFLKDFPNIFFSMSHAENAVLCAVSEQPIGADVQDIRTLKADISGRICTPAELERLNAADDKDRGLCRLWCLKESFGKLTGKGFSEGFTQIDTQKLLNEQKAFLTERGGFFISACTSSPETAELRQVTEQELTSALYKSTRIGSNF